MGRDDAELSLLLVDDGTMRRLNREWRGRDAATDVLSFPQPVVSPPRGGDAAGAPLPLGDVVISLDTARAQAREAGIPLGRELCRLLAHGILHLLGHDHEGPGPEGRRMRALEDRLARGGRG